MPPVLTTRHSLTLALLALAASPVVQAAKPIPSPSPSPTPPSLFDEPPTAPLDVLTAPEVGGAPPRAPLLPEASSATAPPLVPVPVATSTAELPPVPAPETQFQPPALPPTLKDSSTPETLDATKPPETEITLPPPLNPVEPEIASGPYPAHLESDSVSSVDYDPRTPVYQQTHPNWGVEVSTSLKALGSTPPVRQLGENRITGLSFQMEYQPSSTQKYGVLSFGPSLNIYPVLPKSGILDSADSTSAYSGRGGLRSIGGQIRYQARFFREQPVVPEVGYDLEFWNYNTQSQGSGNFIASGAFIGGMLLLNVLEPSAASAFYANYGVSRTYLVAELRTLSGSDAHMTISGSSYFFGLRFEF